MGIELADLSDLGASHSNRIVFSNTREHLLLLSLVIKDSALVLACTEPLSSEKRISSGNDDALTEHFGNSAADELSDEHHGAVSNSRVTDLPILSSVTNFNIFSKEVIFGDPYTSQIHKAVFLGMESNFRPDISSLDSREPVVILVLDLNQKRMHSIVFALYQGLSEDNGIICKN